MTYINCNKQQYNYVYCIIYMGSEKNKLYSRVKYAVYLYVISTQFIYRMELIVGMYYYFFFFRKYQSCQKLYLSDT